MSVNKPVIGMINIVVDGDYQYEQEVPLGMGALGAFLREHEYHVLFHQCFASKGEERIDLAVNIEADVYGIQLNTNNYLFAREFVKKLKAIRPNVKTVMGGPFLVSISETILENEPLYDYVVIGEGEVTFLELLKAIENKESDLVNVKGLVWRDATGKVRTNCYRDLIANIDDLPFPARDFLDTARKDGLDGGLIESVRLITSRGCIGRCSFCCVNAYNKVQKGKIWRGRSPQNVVDEIDNLSKTFGARVFNFSDSSFEDPGEIGKKRSKEICAEIIKRKIPFSAKIYMRCETMKSDEDIELLKLYKKAGIDVIIIGVEAGSDYELKLYEKNANAEDNYRTATILRELDLFYVILGFIMFGPNSTFETLRSNISFLHKNHFADNINHLGNILMLFKDSKLYHILKQEGRVIEPDNFWELPKYIMKDEKVSKVASLWQNIFNKYPKTFKVSKLQVEMGNVISRMENTMNSHILEAFHNEYAEFRQKQKLLSSEMSVLNYNHFNQILEMVEQDCEDADIQKIQEEFFVKTYGHYHDIYRDTYDAFLGGIQNKGFGISGLVFEHFTSAIALGENERIK